MLWQQALHFVYASPLYYKACQAYMKTSFTDAVLARAGKLYLQLRLGKKESVEQELNLK